MQRSQILQEFLGQRDEIKLQIVNRWWILCVFMCGTLLCLIWLISSKECFSHKITSRRTLNIRVIERCDDGVRLEFTYHAGFAIGTFSFDELTIKPPFDCSKVRVSHSEQGRSFGAYTIDHGWLFLYSYTKDAFWTVGRLRGSDGSDITYWTRVRDELSNSNNLPAMEFAKSE